MTKANNPSDQDDPFDLQRFVSAQEDNYCDARKELERGKKQTHWMWYVFPQIDGLGHSSMSKRYAIKSKEEAQQYLEHPVLGARLLKCVSIILNLEGRSALDIFGSPDNMKLQSSMTLFAAVAHSEPRFTRVLDKYFRGEQDHKTLSLLDQIK